MSKISNANTITHYVDASLRVMRRVERDLEKLYPSASVSSRPLAMASAIGRDLSGLAVLSRGLNAIAKAGMAAIGATQGPRHVDVQFLLERETLKPVIEVLHEELIGRSDAAVSAAA